MDSEQLAVLHPVTLAVLADLALRAMGAYWTADALAIRDQVGVPGLPVADRQDAS